MVVYTTAVLGTSSSVNFVLGFGCFLFTAEETIICHII